MPLFQSLKLQASEQLFAPLLFSLFSNTAEKSFPLFGCECILEASR